MERAEAEAVYEQGRETVVAVLLELAAQNALLRREVAELSEANRRLEIRVADLEERRARNSRNSSLPPSQDPPSAPPRPRQAASGRRAGAQPGHPGRGRHLAPIESLDEAIDHWPSRCACGHRFSETERCPVGKPARHQVVELPPTAVLLSEHRLQRLRCPECGATTRAKLPPDVPRGAFGPRLQAAVASLAVRNRVSRRDAVELVGELFGARISAGSVEAILQRAATAPCEPYEDLLRQIRSASALNIDETGGRTAGERRTLQGRAHRAGGALPQRRGSPPPRGPGAARRGLLRQRLRGPLVGLSTTSTRSDASSAGRTWGATSPPTARDSAPRRSSARPALRSRSDCSRPGVSSAGTLTATACLSVSARSRRSSARCSKRRRAKRPATAATAPSPRTCSSAGRRCGPLPSSTVSSPPTTMPSVASAARSSTASSPWAASPRRASASSNDCSRPRLPAACRSAPSLPTSPTSLPLRSAATPSPCWPDQAGDLNAYQNLGLCSTFAHEALRPVTPSACFLNLVSLVRFQPGAPFVPAYGDFSFRQSADTGSSLRPSRCRGAVGPSSASYVT